MIREIRRRHKLIWLGLAVLLPLLLAASVVFRHAEPVNDKIPTISTQKR
ncbi:MAG: hypothetical protein JSS81_09820 [Acidobacteria bacterium]|nr:hypothetical protein [Acidobacteriota bacterium]